MKHNGETQRVSLLSASLQDLPEQPEALLRTRAFAQPLLMGANLDTGEDAMAHADAVTTILQQIGGSEAMQATSYLVYAAEHLQKPEEVIAKAFGASYAELALETARLIRVQRQARAVVAEAQMAAIQTENVRKMLLAFSRDLRVVLLRLASRLQTLRYYAASKLPVPHSLPMSLCMFLRHWRTAWVFGRSSGKWKTWRFVFWNQRHTATSPSCWMKSVWNARTTCCNCAKPWRST